MTTYHDVVLDYRKVRIPSETHQEEEWFDLKRVFAAIGYASYTTHQETALKESPVRLYSKRKRVYANVAALEYLRDNIAMSRRKKANLGKLLLMLNPPSPATRYTEEELRIGFALVETPEAVPEPQQEWLSLDRREQIRNGSPIRIYIAGRMSYLEFRPLEYGEEPRNRALLNIKLHKSDGKDGGAKYKLGEPESFYFGGRYEYTGPFFLGDNHGCINDIKSHGVDEYAWEEVDSWEGVTQQTIVDVCTRQIADADLVFAWLGSDSDQAHGTLVEIGYATGLGTPVYVASTAEDSQETWFAKRMAYKWFVRPSFMSAFQAVTEDYKANLRQ